MNDKIVQNDIIKIKPCTLNTPWDFLLKLKKGCILH